MVPAREDEDRQNRRGNAIVGAETTNLKKTALYDLHVDQGGKMVPFAGYECRCGILQGCLASITTLAHWRRYSMSRMGQVALRGDDPAVALEKLVPGDIAGLALGRMRYAQFTNDVGSMLDDLIVTNVGEYLFLVVNAACKYADIAHLKNGLSPMIEVDVLDDRSLIAPRAVRRWCCRNTRQARKTCLSRHYPESTVVQSP